MNATPLLSSLLAALAEVKVEVVLIGNAAAAIQGAPVTTINFDFMFRDTPTNLRKLKMAAKGLPAIATALEPKELKKFVVAPRRESPI
jgi:hypothetical protein